MIRVDPVIATRCQPCFIAGCAVGTSKIGIKERSGGVTVGVITRCWLS